MIPQEGEMIIFKKKHKIDAKKKIPFGGTGVF